MESYTFDDILAIAKLIPTINREALTNDDLTYWHNQLNKKKRTLTEFINAFGGEGLIRYIYFFILLIIPICI